MDYEQRWQALKNFIKSPPPDSWTIEGLLKKMGELEAETSGTQPPFAWDRRPGFPDVPVLQPRYDALLAENAELRKSRMPIVIKTMNCGDQYVASATMGDDTVVARDVGGSPDEAVGACLRAICLAYPYRPFSIQLVYRHK